MSAPTPLWQKLKNEPLPSWMVVQNPAPTSHHMQPTSAPAVPQNRCATNTFVVWPQQTAKPSTTVHHKKEEKEEDEKSTKKTIPKPLPKPKSPLFTKLPPEVHLLIFDNLGPASQRLLAATCKHLYGLHKQHYHSNIIHTFARATTLEPKVRQTYYDVIVVSFEQDIEATGYTLEFIAIVSKWLGLGGREGRVAYFKWLRQWRKDRQEEAIKQGRKYEARCFPTLGKRFFEY